MHDLVATDDIAAGDIAARRLLITAGAILAQQGHGDMTRGHLSIRLPGTPGQFLMKPHSVGLDEITMENILTIDLEGRVVAGPSRRHSEVFIHSEIFRARPDVHAVIHTHPTHSVALSNTGRPIRPLSQGGALFVDNLPVYAETMDLIRTPELGRGVAAALGPHRAVLLRSHGVVMTGRSIAEATICCIMLEEAARIQLLVEAVTCDGPEFLADDVARLRSKLSEPDQYAVNFAYLARRAAPRT